MARMEAVIARFNEAFKGLEAACEQAFAAPAAAQAEIKSLEEKCARLEEAQAGRPLAAPPDAAMDRPMDKDEALKYLEQAIALLRGLADTAENPQENQRENLSEPAPVSLPNAQTADTDAPPYEDEENYEENYPAEEPSKPIPFAGSPSR